MMYRGGGIGGGWAFFSPTWFWRPRPLSSRSTLSPLASPLLLSLSRVAGSLSHSHPLYCGLPALQPFLLE
jgi:hypothetical protein